MRREPIPRLTETIRPPMVLGTAALTHAAFAGAGPDALSNLIEAANSDPVARGFDYSVAYQLGFRRGEALDLQNEALAASPLYRVRSIAASSEPLRLLALLTPGDLMVNTPLDFITRYLDVRLDLLHLLSGENLPDEIPEHDIAFVASSDHDAETVARLCELFASWPRPILNDPHFLPCLRRDKLASRLRGLDGICSPRCVAVERAALDAHVASGAALGSLLGVCDRPVLVRPQGSHAGAGLKRVTDRAELGSYLTFSFASSYFLSAFVDYRGDDGMFRKYRIAFVDGAPFLCHMAVSQHWMVHYLNAGMVESAAKRAEEAQAMASFEDGFAHRHRAAFAALHEVIGFDLYSIDCAETRDGRLLVFEADTAAILHMMDPPDLFPYKAPQMRRVFAAFEAMLRRRVAAYAEVGAGVRDFAM